MTIIRHMLLVLLLLAASTAALAQDAIYTGRFSNLALDGYDTVAYFTEKMPVKGDPAFSIEYKGAHWRFKNADNLALFSANPEAYAPQYGGYCAYAAAHGEFASAEPELWTVHDGKLYLNYSRSINRRWQDSMQQYIDQADQVWPTLIAD